MAQSLDMIIAADRRAAKIVGDARDERGRILATAKQEENAVLEANAIKLQELQNNLASENDTYKKSIKDKCDEIFTQKKSVLDEQFSRDNNKWINNIFNKITTEI